LRVSSTRSCVVSHPPARLSPVFPARPPPGARSQRLRRFRRPASHSLPRSSLASFAFVRLPLGAHMTSRGRHACARPGRRASARPTPRGRAPTPTVRPSRAADTAHTAARNGLSVGPRRSTTGWMRVPKRDRARPGRGFPAAAAGSAWRDVPSPCP